MKATFEDFIDQNPNCKKFHDSKEARYIFEKILSDDSNIIAMIDEASSAGKPALMSCAIAIESYYESITLPSFELTDNFTKQAVGRMIKTILAPFGYRVKTQKDMPKDTHARYFTSATVYEYDSLQPASLYIKKEIAERKSIQ